MGFPENVLARDEKVELSLHPHWLTVVSAVLLGALLLAIGVLVSWATPASSGWNIVQWVVIGLLVVLAVPGVLWPILRWRTTHYVITTHRVMVRRGVLNKTGKDITLGKITDVSFNQTFLDRIIRAGSLRIESAGEGPDEALANIPNSHRVQQLINRLVDEDDLRRRQMGAGGGPQAFAGGHGERGYAAGAADAGQGQRGRYEDSRGYEQGGYAQQGRGAYDEQAHGDRGYNDRGYDERGYDQGGYDRQGYDQHGYDQRGYDDRGYDQGGYDQRGYDAQGYDRGGYDEQGYDQRGYDQQGYDAQGRGYDAAYDENNVRDTRSFGTRDQDGHY